MLMGGNGAPRVGTYARPFKLSKFDLVTDSVAEISGDLWIFAPLPMAMIGRATKFLGKVHQMMPQISSFRARTPRFVVAEYGGSENSAKTHFRGNGGKND